MKNYPQQLLRHAQHTAVAVGLTLCAACSATRISTLPLTDKDYMKMEKNTSLSTFAAFPTEEQGMERGVSACYAGSCNGMLVMAGGCNFPSQEASDKLQKKYYEGIYAAQTSKGNALEWRRIGTLPQPAAYGVTISTGDKLILVGGNNNEGSLSATYSVTIGTDGNAVTGSMPQLPCTLDNMAGAAIGSTIYVVGGQKDGAQSAEIFALNTDNAEAGWQHFATLPDGMPRVQPVCAAVGKKLYIWGGFANKCEAHAADVFTKGFCLDTETKEFATLPSATDIAGTDITLSGGAAVSADDGKIVCAGGVNRDIFVDAISGTYALVEAKDYAFKPIEWYRFNKTLVVFDTVTGKWLQPTLEHAQLARAGAAMVIHQGCIYYIGGELKPRVRTAETAVIK